MVALGLTSRKVPRPTAAGGRDFGVRCGIRDDQDRPIGRARGGR